MKLSEFSEDFFGRPGFRTRDERVDALFLVMWIVLAIFFAGIIIFLARSGWESNPVGVLALFSLVLFGIAVALWISTPWEASP